MAKDDQKECPICGKAAKVEISARHLDAEFVECIQCGNYGLPGLLRRTTLMGQKSESSIKELFPYLSAHTRQASERGERVMLDSDNWRPLAEAHKATPFKDKKNKLLENLSQISLPGTSARRIANHDFPLIDASGPDEFYLILKQLVDLGYVENKPGRQLIVTGKGWEFLESRVASGGIPGKCFVAMWFDESLNDAYYKGIYLAVKQDCKMDPIRIDLVHHNEKICDKIMAEIRSSQFLVADVTGQRQGVYFEAGFAMGLGRSVIWTCREDQLEEVHFDTRQYSHIVWKSPEDLREKLANRIKATFQV